MEFDLSLDDLHAKGPARPAPEAPRDPAALEGGEGVAPGNGVSKRRGARSYVLRQSHLQNRQKRALESHWAEWVAQTGAPFDFARMFGNDRPVILEIGYGMGDSLAQNALSRPDENFLGIEVHLPGVGNLLALMEEKGIGNLRLVRRDAAEVLRENIPDGSLDGVQIFFPDPWPKKRHHKRRLIQREFADLLAQKVKAGGRLRLATDWEDYAAQMLEVLSNAPNWGNESQEADGFLADRGDRPVTKFERKGVEQGRRIFDLAFRKIA